MPKAPKVEKTYKMVLFRVYCYPKSKPGKEEGVLRMTDNRNKIVESIPEQHFDSYDEIGGFIREHMKAHEAKASQPGHWSQIEEALKTLPIVASEEIAGQEK